MSTLNAVEVIAPKGMEHVGWYCDHEDRETVHRSERWSAKKQAFKLKKQPDTLASIRMLNKYREEQLCPSAVPMFVATTEPGRDMNPARVIAEALAKHRIVGSVGGLLAECGCGEAVDGHAAHQASVIAALPNIAIVPRKDIVRIYRAASTLGQQYMMPTHFGADLEEAERWFGLQQKMLDGLSGVDTVRLEYQDMWFTEWAPLAAGGES